MLGNLPYKAIVIGASAGGLKALQTIISAIPRGFSLPILIAQHLSPQSEGFMAHHLNQISHLQVKEADHGEPIHLFHIYIAPANYHLLVEKNETLSLSVEEKVNYARPSIDVLFESAALVFHKHLIGIILTGANNDGTVGMGLIKKLGGYTIAQSPDSAEVSIMPKAAIDSGCIDKIVSLENIADVLVQLNNQSNA